MGVAVRCDPLSEILERTICLLQYLHTDKEPFSDWGISLHDARPDDQLHHE